ncbi:hypothetical protein IMCC9480_263 [Oxalobacteraceae bacterium IMCC9480]|nr:hypothetical protein IMCC9480_263 [Oxalobacteraceae bacterium IMCC9480]
MQAQEFTAKTNAFGVGEYRICVGDSIHARLLALGKVGRQTYFLPRGRRFF